MNLRWSNLWRGAGAVLWLSFYGSSVSAADVQITEYRGMCDASALVDLTDGLFAVADDEDNVLRVYSRHHGGLPLSQTDLASFLTLNGKHQEADLEAAARIDDVFYW